MASSLREFVLGPGLEAPLLVVPFVHRLHVAVGNLLVSVVQLSLLLWMTRTRPW